MTANGIKTDKPAEKLLIGIGNSYRSDDSAGLIVIRRLKDLHLPGFRIIEESGDGTILLEIWKKAQTVFVVDTVRSGNEPGTILRIDLNKEKLPKEYFRFSTHHFSLADAVRMAHTLNEAPPRFIFFGIEGKNFNAGMDLSPEVNNVLEKFVTDIYKEILQ